MPILFKFLLIFIDNESHSIMNPKVKMKPKATTDIIIITFPSTATLKVANMECYYYNESKESESSEEEIDKENQQSSNRRNDRDDYIVCIFARDTSSSDELSPDSDTYQNRKKKFFIPP